MAQLILKFNDEIVDHIDLAQGDMKIGRKPECDIVIDNLAVSGEHVNIFTIGNDSFIQDLNSTNGTFVNNKKIVKHYLRNGDTITIGKHSLVYIVEETQEDDDYAKTIIINPIAAPQPQFAPPSQPASETPRKTSNPKPTRTGSLYILSGANSGKRIELTRSVTKLGKTGKRAGTVSATPEGYILASVGGKETPKLNGRPVPPDKGVRLRNGDIIDVGGTRLQFYLKSI